MKIEHATADLNLPETPLEPMFYDKSNKKRVTGPIDFAIDGKDETSWGTDAGPGLRNQPRKAVFNAAEPINNEAGTILTFYLRQNAGGWNSDDNQNNNLGRFRLSITNAEGATADPLPADVRAIFAIPRAQRTAFSKPRPSFSYWRATVPEWRDENNTIAKLWSGYPEPTSQLVLDERDQPRTTHQLTRGDFLNPGKEVTAGVSTFLNPLPANAPTNRLTFAKWLVARDSPTTARAFVNRLWQSYFGVGIVETAEDFGTQSSPSSHPELLDWLAVEFMDRNWDVKAMQRLIATSATYRQASNVTPELEARDPYNRLLARGPRFRVDAEIVRDVALAASGLLNPVIGGKSVYPPAPGFLFQPPTSYGPKVWETANNSERYRRALYTFRFRSVPYPALQVFDAPNGESSCVRRARSNTPLQALTTLNEPLFVESALALALKTLDEGGATDVDRLNYAMRRVLARKPSPEESRELLTLLEKEQAHFSDGKHDPVQFAPAVPSGATPAQTAAWTALSRVLLNLDETIDEGITKNGTHISRRLYFEQCGVGLVAIAQRTLLAESAQAAESKKDPMAPKPPQFPAKAKNVIFLFMAGAPSHLELFDNKPALKKFDGTLPPPELLKGYRAAFINPNSKPPRDLQISLRQIRASPGPNSPRYCRTSPPWLTISPS